MQYNVILYTHECATLRLSANHTWDSLDASGCAGGAAFSLEARLCYPTLLVTAVTTTCRLLRPCYNDDTEKKTSNSVSGQSESITNRDPPSVTRKLRSPAPLSPEGPATGTERSHPASVDKEWRLSAACSLSTRSSEARKWSPGPSVFNASTGPQPPRDAIGPAPSWPRPPREGSEYGSLRT